MKKLLLTLSAVSSILSADWSWYSENTSSAIDHTKNTVVNKLGEKDKIPLKKYSLSDLKQIKKNFFKKNPNLKWKVWLSYILNNWWSMRKWIEEWEKNAVWYINSERKNKILVYEKPEYSLISLNNLLEKIVSKYPNRKLWKMISIYTGHWINWSYKYLIKEYTDKNYYDRLKNKYTIVNRVFKEHKTFLDNNWKIINEITKISDIPKEYLITLIVRAEAWAYLNSDMIFDILNKKTYLANK